MAKYFAKRLRFQNGERHSVLVTVNGLPVHEVTLYLSRYRTKGRAANTIHSVCCCLVLLYRVLDSARLNLLDRLAEGRFLTVPELERVASAAQYRLDDLDDEVESQKSNVIHISRIGMRSKQRQEISSVSVESETQGIRLRYIADFLEFLGNYVAPGLPESKRQQFIAEKSLALTTFRSHIPKKSKRAALDARVGLSLDEQNRLLAIVHPDSPNNPWVRGFVRQRNWIIVVMLLATGMRKGELLSLQISDLDSNKPKLRIYRRADAKEDPRVDEPTAKTSDREIELLPAIMKVVWIYVNNERQTIKAARAFPQIIVSDEGEPLSQSSITKIFRQLKDACPGLPTKLTSHVMRHTWNERFSEQADSMGLTEQEEQRARNEQQGWADNSKTSTTYTRRHTSKKGRQLSLKLQEQLDAHLDKKE